MNGAARVRRRLLGQAGQRQLRNIGNIRNGRVRAAPAWPRCVASKDRAFRPAASEPRALRFATTHRQRDHAPLG